MTPLPLTDVAADQIGIVAALEQGTASGDATPLRRIDTHMSHVFLGPRRVYKLKRSIRYPFCDFSTVEARRQACDAELTVNRMLAPDIYQAVLPVIRQPSGVIQLGGEGVALDWVVAMRRFPEGALFEDLADAGRLNPDLVRQAASAIAVFHTAQAPHRETGHAVDYRRIVEGLRATEADGAAKFGVNPGPKTLFTRLEREIARRSPLLESRRRDGWVRRGHGDLHLRNICLFDGRVMPFDALEFDPALATADVIYDVAFLLMDLRAHGLNDLANVAMNQYWDAAGQSEAALALLPLFMALRAAVRMAVAVEAGDLAQAARYRDLGLELLQPRAVRLLAIGGLSGTGKSSLAQSLAPGLSGPCGARLLRTDVLRKRSAGVAPNQQLTDKAYEPEARATIYRLLAQRAREVLDADCSIVADATFREDPTRAAIEGVAKDHEFCGIWLTAPTEVRVVRVGNRHGDASDADEKVALRQVEPRRLRKGWTIIDANRPLAVIGEEARQRCRLEAFRAPG